MSHTDIFLGGDKPMWKIICDSNWPNGVQEVPAPLPKGYCCRYCGAKISPSTSVAGADPRDLVEDMHGVIIEPFTRAVVDRVIRERREERDARPHRVGMTSLLASMQDALDEAVREKSLRETNEGEA